MLANQSWNCKQQSLFHIPLHVMVSNLRERRTDKAPGPYCTGLKRHKYQSEYIQELVWRSSGKSVDELTREEYCAAYLVRFLANVLNW